MRTVGLIAGMIFLAWSANAFSHEAVGPQSSWEEIREAKLLPRFPTLRFGSREIPVVNVCVDGTVYRAETPFGRCVARVDDGGCSHWEPAVVTATRQDSDALEYEVAVYSDFGGSRSERREFTKSFVVASCVQ